MKKILLIIVVMLATSCGLVAQNVLLNENMESYPLNSFLGIDNPTWFTTWSNLPGSGEDAQVLPTFAHSGTKAASADLTGGQTDCILKLGNKTTGRYELKWWMYVETGKCGYYNIQHFQSPGVEWAFEIYFRTAGAVELTAGNVLTTGTYPKNTWFEVNQIIKLDVDSIYLFINGSLLRAWPFHYINSSTIGTNQLGGVDFFAGEFSGSGEIPGFYFDDVVFSELGTLAPTVVTTAATGVTSTTATLNGTVNANVMSTTATFDYGLTTSYGSSIAGVPGTVTGTIATPVSANLTGLLPGTTYHYRIRGVNANGATNGLDMTFTTPAVLPAVITTAATGVNSTGATLNGTVNAGGASTTVTFEYGLTTSYGTIVPGVPGTVTGSTVTPVSAAITGLTVNTTYHYRVVGVNSVGTTNGTDMSFLTTTCPMPGVAGAISGPTAICGNSTGNIYTVAPIANATGYNWTFPAGAIVTGGGNTNTVTVTFGNTPGTVSVYGTNTCGNGSASNLSVTVTPAPVPTITGPVTMCPNSGYFYYTTQPGMTNYTWTTSAGGNITFGQGTNQVQVTWSTSGPQNIYVNYQNATGCFAGTPATLPVTVTALPGAAGNITGTATVCGGTTGVTYSCAPVSGTIAYVWTLPAGAMITAGDSTNSITVSFAPDASSGPVTVYGNNLCGNGSVSPAYGVTVNPMAAPAGIITGPASVCQGATGIVYTVPVITNAAGYSWSVPAGAIIVSDSNSNSITVDFLPTATSGVITVFGRNSCGNGPVSPDFVLTANPVPVSPVITAAEDVLSSNASAGNQWYRNGSPISGATSQTYTATQSGEYWDVVTLNTCSSDTSNHIWIVITGVNDLQNQSISVYPNPNDGKFTVKFTSSKQETFNISVVNTNGVRIMEIKDVVVNGNAEKSIDLRPVPAGIYSVVIRNNESLVVKKVVVR